jgi:hypothetical protein
LQRGQGRGSVRLLREEGEQGLRGHVGPSEAKVGLLLLIRRRWPLRRRDLLPSAARRGELRQQRAYHRRVHCASGATVDGVRTSCLRARARERDRAREREKKKRKADSSSFSNEEEETNKRLRGKKVGGRQCSASTVNSSLSTPFSLSLALSLARSRTRAPFSPCQRTETPTGSEPADQKGERPRATEKKRETGHDKAVDRRRRRP